MANLIQLCLVPFMDSSGLFMWITAIFTVILSFNIIYDFFR